MANGIFIFVAAALAVAGLALPVRSVLEKLGVLDRPTARSSHNCPTARGGGIAIMGVILIGTLSLGLARQNGELLGLALLAFFLATVSFIDDLKSVSPLVRFGCHAVAAIGALWFLGTGAMRLEIWPGQFWNWTEWGVLLAGFLWLTGYTNAFNFMDGINGISASQAALTAAGAGILVGVQTGRWGEEPVLFCFLVAGAATGFLPHNFPRARLFMGDVGSAPLGFLLAALVLWLARDFGSTLMIPLALLHANFVLDTSLTFLRRMFRGERIVEPHRDHFYQRLVRAGKSHAFVTSCEFGLQLVVLGLMIGYLRASAPVRQGLIVCVFAIWGAFFAFCEAKFLRAQNASKPTIRHGQPPSKITAPDLPFGS